MAERVHVVLALQANEPLWDLPADLQAGVPDTPSGSSQLGGRPLGEGNFQIRGATEGDCDQRAGLGTGQDRLPPLGVGRALERVEAPFRIFWWPSVGCAPVIRATCGCMS
jgi:hypothetical protein